MTPPRPPSTDAYVTHSFPCGPCLLQIVIDHWTVDEGLLPDYLRFDPHVSGHAPYDPVDVSPECDEVLRGLFDPRPGYRYGGTAHTLQQLREHPWFIRNHIPTWRDLEVKQ